LPIESTLREHHQAAFIWALQLCDGNRDDALDVLQESYLKVLNGKAKFHQRSTFKTWLFGVIKRTHLEGVRCKNRYLKTVVVLSNQQEDHLSVTEPVDDRQIIKAQLARLPQRQREVLTLVFYHNLTIEQAAQIMEVSLGSARTHYTRGKKRLKEWLTPKLT